MQTFKSALSGVEYPMSERLPANMINEALLKKVKEKNPEFCEEDSISISEINALKLQYLSDHLLEEIGDLGELEKTVLDSIGERKTISTRLDDDNPPTFGQRLADKVATFGGSWRFIILFSVILILWILANAILLHDKGFDPYPFILLNLILSCLAALQAPVIMMSQNRQEEKDRERAKNDYMVNLKSELEIRMLHEKLDHLILRQQQNIIEIQQDQIEQMNKFMERLGAQDKQ